MQLAAPKGTIAICFVEKALQPVRERGLDIDALLAAAGVPARLLALPQTRVSAASYSTLWRQINHALDDEFFGQDSRRMKVGSFAMLCHIVIHCQTLGHALRRALRYFDLLLDDLSCTLSVERADARVTLHVRAGTPVRIFAHGTLLVMLHGLMCWLVGRRIRIRVAHFAYPEPAYSTEYHLTYSPVLEFCCPCTDIVFDGSYLDLPVIQTEQTLKSFLRTAPENVVLKYKNQHGLAARIREKLKTQPLDRWPTFDGLATGLGLGASTLRRRLKDEGQTYQIIKDELRRDMAISFLCDTEKNVDEIAIELGFAEPSAFHRAFRRWTGARPGAYRLRS
ncbi:AraC family transcriptional regulator [Paraburkholderia xenovorans]|jgi:AraC-like DNA-binding protein